jgi:hypothetical protein
MKRGYFGISAALFLCLSLALVSCGSGGSDTHGACVSSSGLTCGNDFTESECSTVNGKFHANQSCCNLGYCSSNGGVSQTLVNGIAITSFSFASPAVSGTIDAFTNTISVVVPRETNVTSLVASFTTTGTTVSVGSTVQVSGSTMNNFTNPVAYTVTATDGTTVTYVVKVTFQAS